MNFYLLSLAVAISTIFGLTQSQVAREKLHLQKLYEWTSATITQKLQQYNLFRNERRANSTDVTQTSEISVDSSEEKKLENAESFESIEEIQGIRLGAEEDSNIQISLDDTCELPRSQDDAVLAAINASLRKLSAAASSGRINGAQLYEILLQETMAHRERTNDDACPAASLVEVTDEEITTPTTTTKMSSVEKPKMYFGDPPMEYVPHQE